ncbi:MAG: DUF4286 family protein [Bacteroidetes bacterium]|nr:DUF4286 family protein [Bacteroidota bacterium]
MIQYNVTCLVDPEIEQEWLGWMRDVHLPEVMATGKFVSYRMFKIDPHEDGDSGATYAVQYLLENRELFSDYVTNHGPALKAKTLAKYGERVQAFRTLMEQVL